MSSKEVIFDTDKLNEFIRESAAQIPVIHKNMLDIDVKELMESAQNKADQIFDINLLKVSDLRALLNHCRRIHDSLTLQMEQNGGDGFDILTVEQTQALLKTGFLHHMEQLLQPYESLFIDPQTNGYFVEPCLIDQITKPDYRLMAP